MRSASQLLASLFALLVALSSFALAQTATTSLRGTVTDPKGAVLQGATVTLNNAQTGFSRTTRTGSDGVYQFLQVSPATYTLTVVAAGFGTLKRDNVTLQVSLPATLDVSMEVKGRSEVVEVTGEATLVNTSDATLGHAFGAEQILNLPAEGRDPVSILSLQPGVVYVGRNVDQTFDSRGGSVNGARSDQTNVTLDGIDNNDQELGLAFQGALRTPLESIEEFRVTTSSSNADVGRSSGAQVALLTKSGTNTFHGSVYEYNRSNVGEANDWFNKHNQLNSGFPNEPPHLVRNTFGATAGGPVRKDRVFFFTAFEGQRSRENFQVTRIVPSDNLRNGIVQYLTCGAGAATDCDNPTQVVTLSPQQFASMDPNCTSIGSCPLGPGANPAVMAVFQKYPHPNNDTVGDGLNFRGFTFSSPGPAKLDTYTAKIDFNLTQNGNHHVFVRGGLQNDHFVEKKESVSQTGDSGSEFPGLPPNLTGLSNSKGIIASYNAVLSSNLINSFRYGFIRQGVDNIGLKDQHFVHFRGLDNPQGFTTSTQSHVPVNNFVDDVTWTKGKHTLQFGGNFRIVNNIRRSDSTSFFTASTNVSWLDNAAIAQTGSSLDPGAFGFPDVADSFTNSYDSPVSALAGLVVEVDSNYNLTKTLAALPEGAFVPRHFRAHEFETYGQDSWRVTPNLVLTFGLRYTLLQPPYETTGTQTAPSVSLNDWFSRRFAAMQVGQTYAPTVTFNLSGQANGKQPYWNWDYKDIAPRFAFAWSPSAESGFFRKFLGGAGKTSIRGGYGIYYDHFGQGITNSFDRNGSFGLSTQISNSAGIQDVDTAARMTDLFTIPTTSQQTVKGICDTPPCSIINPPPGGSFPVTPPPTAFSITWGLDDKLKTPYSHVFDFSITRELPSGFVFEAAYVGRLGRRLLQEDDLAMPLDIRDPKSGMDYFKATTMLTKAAVAGTDISQLAPIPYWENLFPSAAGNLGFGTPGKSSHLGCAPGDSVSATNYTATQAMYDMYSCFPFNETSGLFVADLLCLPACSQLAGQPAGGQPFNFFDPQWSSLYAWRSIGNASYHAAQFMLRHATSHGLSLDFNYTFSKSIDIGSNAERINQFEGFGLGSQIINSWQPNALRAVSDFDTHHQITTNWIYELPVGRGKAFGGDLHGVSQAVLGGWNLSGLARWTSGYPFGVGPGLGFWSTNWELTSSAFQTSPVKTGTFIDANGNPNVFSNFAAATNSFRKAFPGESGQRNELRGPGFFSIDLGLGKSWKTTESQALTFRAEAFNISNSVRFDVATATINNLSLVNSTNFGKYISTLSSPRVMQFSLRYSF
jgi:hypothetical protein